MRLLILLPVLCHLACAQPPDAWRRYYDTIVVKLGRPSSEDFLQIKPPSVPSASGERTTTTPSTAFPRPENFPTPTVPKTAEINQAETFRFGNSPSATTANGNRHDADENPLVKTVTANMPFRPAPQNGSDSGTGDLRKDQGRSDEINPLIRQPAPAVKSSRANGELAGYDADGKPVYRSSGFSANARPSNNARDVPSAARVYQTAAPPVTTTRRIIVFRRTTARPAYTHTWPTTTTVRPTAAPFASYRREPLSIPYGQQDSWRSRKAAPLIVPARASPLQPARPLNSQQSQPRNSQRPNSWSQQAYTNYAKFYHAWRTAQLRALRQQQAQAPRQPIRSQSAAPRPPQPSASQLQAIAAARAAAQQQRLAQARANSARNQANQRAVLSSANQARIQPANELPTVPRANQWYYRQPSAVATTRPPVTVADFPTQRTLTDEERAIQSNFNHSAQNGAWRPTVRPQLNRGNAFQLYYGPQYPQPQTGNYGGYGQQATTRRPEPTTSSAEASPLRRCFAVVEDYAVANIAPYERRSYINETICLQRCLEMLTSDRLPCKLVVFGERFHTCDLFRQSVTERPAKTVPLKGYNYYVPTGQDCDVGSVTEVPTLPTITSTSTATVSPVTTTRPGESCPSGTTATFYRAEGYELLGSDGLVVGDLSEADCVEVCRTNTSPDGIAYRCLSLDYDSSERTCILSTEAATPTKSGVLRSAENTVYYEKVCLRDDIVSTCRGEIGREPQHVMLSFGETVETVGSMAECVELCFDAESLFNLRCLSVLYFYDESDLNCLLNTESSRTEPQFYVEETENQVEYLGLDDCQTFLHAGRSRPQFLENRVPDPFGPEPQSVDETPASPFDRRKLIGSRGDATSNKRYPAPVRNPTSDFKPLLFASSSQLDELTSVRKTSRLAAQSEPSSASISATSSRARSPAVEERVTLLLGGWAEWSACDRRSSGRRRRFRRCNAPNVRLCPFETQWCNLAPAAADQQSKKPRLGMVIPQNEFLRRDVPIEMVIEDSAENDPVRYNGRLAVKFTRPRQPASRKTADTSRCVPFRGRCNVGIRILSSGAKRYCLNVDAPHCKKISVS